MSGTLVVGASQAGVQLAVSLREAGDTAPITLVGAEAHPPYQRPPLSKEYLTGATDAPRLALRTPEFYVERDVEVITGERVTVLGPGRAETDRGRTIEHERLALTVGARVRRLGVPGTELAGVLHLRDRDDADRLRTALGVARRVVVVGGGFVGLEAAAVASGLGTSVTVVEAGDRLMARAVAPVVSEFYRRAHEQRGVRVLTSTTVSAVLGRGDDTSARGRAVRAVLLADGTELPADLVLVGVGVSPRTELAEQLGLVCDDGIPVDRNARTALPGVVAAGDCTVQPHPVAGRPGRVRVESVPNAVHQAKVAAASLAGVATPPREVPWFWSNQGDLRLQIAGLSTDPDEIVLRGDPGAGRFAALHYGRGRLLAVDAVNSPADFLVVRRALTAGIDLPVEAARQTGRPLKELLAT